MNLEKLLKLLASVAIAALVAAAVSSCHTGGGAKAPVSSAPEKATPSAEPRVVEMKVTENGYEPSPLTVKKGEPLLLRITRTTDATCAKEILFPEYGIEKELPLDEAVDVEFTPTEAGTLKYGCSMGMMIAGVIVVE